MPFAQAITRQGLLVPVVAVRVMEPLAHSGRLRVGVDGDGEAAAIGKLACHGGPWYPTPTIHSGLLFYALGNQEAISRILLGG